MELIQSLARAQIRGHLCSFLTGALSATSLKKVSSLSRNGANLVLTQQVTRERENVVSRNPGKDGKREGVWSGEAFPTE